MNRALTLVIICAIAAFAFGIWSQQHRPPALLTDPVGQWRAPDGLQLVGCHAHAARHGFCDRSPVHV